MGLSSKQVSSDGLDWNQQATLLHDQSLQLPKPPTIRRLPPQQNLQQQHEKLKCPRCDSTNTKFCYYNNYNKLQPRHFCKACKRHWTKGGTLRNVPVGGGRKNKRLKTSTTAATKKNTQVQNPPLAVGDHQRSISDIFYQSLFRPPPWPLQQDFSDTGNLDGKNLIPNLPQTQNLLFPFSSSGSFESNPSSVSTFFKSPNGYSFIGDHDQSKNMEDPTVSSILASGGAVDQPWQMPAASYWNWDDMDTFTTTTDLQIHWDDSEMKP